MFTSKKSTIKFSSELRCTSFQWEIIHKIVKKRTKVSRKQRKVVKKKKRVQNMARDQSKGLWRRKNKKREYLKKDIIICLKKASKN